MADVFTLGELIDEAYRLREEKRTVEEEVKGLASELREIEHQILEKIESLGVTTARASLASVTITEQLVPQVEDFDKALDWVGEDFDNRKHMLYRRITSGSYKELLDTGEEVPGVVPYTKRTVSIRKLSS